jgi:hypothetical protein
VLGKDYFGMHLGLGIMWGCLRRHCVFFGRTVAKIDGDFAGVQRTPPESMEECKALSEYHTFVLGLIYYF